MPFTLKVEDDRAVKRLVALQPNKALPPVLKLWALRFLADLQRYPPARAESTYRRTGTLGRAWTVTGEGLRWVVGNNTVYAPWVQDPERQAAMHAGTWQTTRGVYEARRQDFLTDIHAAFGKVTEEG